MSYEDRLIFYGNPTKVCPVCDKDVETWKFKRWESYDEDRNENKDVRKFLKRRGHKSGMKVGTEICKDYCDEIDSLFYGWKK